MPVNYAESVKAGETLYQRDQYAKGGLGVLYWDYRDKIILSGIQKDAQVILDVGCGEGITLEKICKAFPGREVTGLDVMDDNIAICQKHGLPVCKGDVYRLDMPDSSVDCCIFSEVIEHLNDSRSALLEIRRVLRPGGRVIIVFPNDFMFKISRIMTGMLKEAFYNPGHVKQWTPGEMCQILTSMGFSVITSYSLPFAFWPICLHQVVTAEKASSVCNGNGKTK